MGKIEYREPTENDVTVWSVSVGNLPFPLFASKSVRLAVKLIKEQEGFLFFYPCYPHGTLCLFRTENDAKGARNVMRFKGIQCGDNICKLFVDKKYVK